MTLGQFKSSLAKFPADMDSAEVLFVFSPDGKTRDVDLTCAVGIVPFDDTAHVAIVGHSEIARIQRATGELPPLGKIIPPPPIEGDEWKQ